jgi:hypothetical protein
MQILDLGPRYAPLFAALQKAGFTCVVQSHEPGAFGNFVVICSSAAGKVRVTSDRGQVFVDVSVDGESWQEKEMLLERLGLARDRYPTEQGLWRGYAPEVQATELEQHLPALLAEAARAE